MVGYSQHNEAVQRRLPRIEGQARGSERMIDDDEYVVDVLTHISAATPAL